MYVAFCSWKYKGFSGIQLNSSKTGPSHFAYTEDLASVLSHFSCNLGCLPHGLHGPHIPTPNVSRFFRCCKAYSGVLSGGYHPPLSRDFILSTTLKLSSSGMFGCLSDGCINAALKISVTRVCFMGRVVSPTPNPQPGGPAFFCQGVLPLAFG